MHMSIGALRVQKELDAMIPCSWSPCPTPHGSWELKSDLQEQYVLSAALSLSIPLLQHA